jgi:dTDP-4-dehydrorhamnose 3,5-epimerase-like enzyme
VSVGGASRLQPQPWSVDDDGPRRVPPPAHRLDERGALTAVELDELPFPVRRVFTVSGVPAGTRRGGHRHRWGDQAVFCTSGRVEVELLASDHHDLVVLEPGGPGVVIPAGVWSSQRYTDDDSALLVVCSERYDPDSYDSERVLPPGAGPTQG